MPQGPEPCWRLELGWERWEGWGRLASWERSCDSETRGRKGWCGMGLPATRQAASRAGRERRGGNRRGCSRAVRQEPSQDPPSAVHQTLSACGWDTPSLGSRFLGSELVGSRGGGGPRAGTQGGWPAPPRFVDGEGAPRCLACWQCSLRVKRCSKGRSQARLTARRSERPLLSHVTPAPAVQGSLSQIRLLSVFVPLLLGEQHRSVWCLH